MNLLILDTSCGWDDTCVAFCVRPLSLSAVFQARSHYGARQHFISFRGWLLPRGVRRPLLHTGQLTGVWVASSHWLISNALGALLDGVSVRRCVCAHTLPVRLVPALWALAVALICVSPTSNDAEPLLCASSYSHALAQKRAHGVLAHFPAGLVFLLLSWKGFQCRLGARLLSEIQLSDIDVPTVRLRAHSSSRVP